MNSNTSPPDSSSSDAKPHFEELLAVLQYNQGLVEFADSKASSLILLNSLLIAAVAALPNSGHMGILKMTSVLVASAAVYLCFQVIASTAGSASDVTSPLSSKTKATTNWQSDDYLFFNCVVGYKTGDDYCRAYGKSDPDARRRAFIQRTYVIAGIAKRKFGQYALAQKVTTAAMAVWVSVNVVPFLGI